MIALNVDNIIGSGGHWQSKIFATNLPGLTTLKMALMIRSESRSVPLHGLDEFHFYPEWNCKGISKLSIVDRTARWQR